MDTTRRNRGRERGQGLVEFALTLPIFVMLFISVFDLSRAILVSNILAGAARDGARFGTIEPTNTSGIIATAMGRVFAVNPGEVTVAVTCSPICTYGNDLTVKTTYPFKPVTPFIPQVTLFGISTMSIE